MVSRTCTASLSKLDSPVNVDINQNEIYSCNMNDDWELLKPKITPDFDDEKFRDWVDTSREMRCSVDRVRE